MGFEKTNYTEKNIQINANPNKNKTTATRNLLKFSVFFGGGVKIKRGGGCLEICKKTWQQIFSYFHVLSLAFPKEQLIFV